MADRKILTGITSEAFTSDSDRWALDKVKRMPLVPTLVSKFYEYGFDRWLYCYNMSMSVRCGPNQYQTLHRILQESCKVLDMPEPELYLSSNPFPNAFAGGVERPYITLRSAIVNTMSDEQLYHLIGHELASGDEGPRQPSRLRILPHRLAQHIAGADVKQTQSLTEELGLRSFAASRRSDDDEYHGRREAGLRRQWRSSRPEKSE